MQIGEDGIVREKKYTQRINSEEDTEQLMIGKLSEGSILGKTLLEKISEYQKLFLEEVKLVDIFKSIDNAEIYGEDLNILFKFTDEEIRRVVILLLCNENDKLPFSLKEYVYLVKNNAVTPTYQLDYEFLEGVLVSIGYEFYPDETCSGG